MRFNEFARRGFSASPWLAAALGAGGRRPSAARAVTVSPGEMAEARRWAAAMFEGAAAPAAIDPGLEVVANYDAVQKNTRFGKPLKLAGTTYTRGLFCHATSKIVVRLPRRARRSRPWSASTATSRPSAAAAASSSASQVGGKEAFRSAVLKRRDAAGAGEGRSGRRHGVRPGGRRLPATESPAIRPTGPTPRSRWPTGKTVWLADLPMAGGPAVADPASPPFSFIYDGQPSSRVAEGLEARADVEAARRRNGPSGRSPTPIPKTGLVVRVRRRSSTTTSPRSSGRCTSRTPARPPRRSWRTSRPSTCGSPAGTTASSCCTTPWAAPARRTTTRPLETPLRAEDGEADRRRRRPADQLRHVLLQPGSAHRARRDRRRRLAGPVVVARGPATATSGCAFRPARS